MSLWNGELPSCAMNSDELKRFERRAIKAMSKVQAQREEILEAFVAKYGFDPEKVTQVLRIMPNGDTVWFVREKTKEDECRLD